MNLEDLRAAHPDLCAALIAEGVTQGAAAELSRVLAVEAQALPGHEKLIAQLKADGITTGPMAAVAVLGAERAVTAGRAAALAADAPAAVAHAAAPAAEAAAADAALTIEERARKDWDAKAAHCAGFTGFDNYLAYAKAAAAGNVKVLSHK